MGARDTVLINLILTLALCVPLWLRSSYQTISVTAQCLTFGLIPGTNIFGRASTNDGPYLMRGYPSMIFCPSILHPERLSSRKATKEGMHVSKKFRSSVISCYDAWINNYHSLNVFSSFPWMNFIIFGWWLFQVSSMRRFQIPIRVLDAKGIWDPFCNPSRLRTVSVAILHVVISCRFLHLLSNLEGKKFPNCNLEFGLDISMILTTLYVQDYPIHSR
jgi:hypothetical protein